MELKISGFGIFICFCLSLLHIFHSYRRKEVLPRKRKHIDEESPEETKKSKTESSGN
jgi:hypothetical protein